MSRHRQMRRMRAILGFPAGEPSEDSAFTARAAGRRSAGGGRPA
jgi:hypothetical protein